MEYTTNKGRIVQAIIYTGNNTIAIEELGLIVTGTGSSIIVNDFVCNVGDYVVYDDNGFVEIMSESNFE